MAYITCSTNDGYVVVEDANWAAVRGAGSGYARSNYTSGLMTATVLYAGRGGGLTPVIARGFFEFDSSGISVAPTEATLKIYGTSAGTADVIAVRSDQSATLSNGDFNHLYNASSQLSATDGSGAGTLAGISGLTYSSELATWSTSGYNEIALNATALADMASLDNFKVCIMEYDYDYLDINPATATHVQNNCRWQDYSGTSSDPIVEFTAGTAAVADNAVFFGTNF